MATLALAPVPAPPTATTNRDVAAIIAGHRTIRQQILARSTPPPPPSATPGAGFQPKDALARLEQIEQDFARYRKKSAAQLEAAHTENRRLRAQIKEAEAKFAHLAASSTNCNSEQPVKVKSIPASGMSTSSITSGGVTKPHEKELSVSRLEASTTAAEKEQKTMTMSGTTPVPPRFAKRNQSARPAESRWRPFTVSRSRSATCVTRSALEDRDDGVGMGSDVGTGVGVGMNGKRGRASTGGLFKRSSLSFSRSNRSSRGSDKSRPGSGMWTNCF